MGMNVTGERLTVSNTVKVLTSSVYANKHKAFISVETAAIRFTLNGTAPVAATNGHLALAGQVIELEDVSEITGFQAIRDTGTDAAIEVSYR